MHESIFDAALSAPGDDGPRYVLADLLMHRGDPLGEIVSLQCRQAALGVHFEPAGGSRLRELWAQHAPEVKARFFERPDALERVVFHRGLPQLVRAGAEAWLSQADPPAPIGTLELSDVAPRHLPALLARPSTKRLAALRLRAADGERWSLDEARLLGSAELPFLQHLALFHAWQNHVAAHAFAASPLVKQLKSVELGHSLSTDPLRVLEALAGAATALEEISLDDDLPVSVARFVGSCRVVSFPDSFVRPQLSEALAHRVALYLPVHVTAPPTKGGPRIGRWHGLTPLGVRNGLDATFAREETTGLGGLLLRVRSLTADFSSPRHWLEPGMGQPDPGGPTLGPVDGGAVPGGEWAAFALASGERLDRLVDREGKLPLSFAAHAGAWSRVARWSAANRLSKPAPLSAIFAGRRGLQVQPLCGELHSRRRGPARFTRREFIELSPEAVRGHALDEKNTAWGLAMQLCLTAGLRVFGDVPRTDHELLQQILQGPAIELYGHGLPAKLRELLKACFNRDRAMRPALQALADALSVFDDAATRAELERLPEPGDELERAKEQAEGWLEGSSVHEPEPIT